MCRHSTADVNSRCRDVRADVAGLEEAVLLTLKKQLEILLPVHKDGTIHLEATAAKCSEYEKQLEALKDQKQALFERYLLGQIELDTYKSEKAVYDAEILKVKNAYAAVTAQAKLKREEQARQSSRQEIVHSIAEADVLTSELTDLLIEKVYVFPDNRIEIIYKVHDLFEYLKVQKRKTQAIKSILVAWVFCFSELYFFCRVLDIRVPQIVEANGRKLCVPEQRFHPAICRLR